MPTQWEGSVLGRLLGPRLFALLGPLAALVTAALVTLAIFWRLGDTPGGLYIDEASISLTARSLWQTGKDLVGAAWPLYPFQYPDHQRAMPVNPLYTYSAIPFALMGPSAFWARLPAALWLLAAALGTGLAANELTRRRAAGVAMGAAAGLAPWLFVLGRVGWEAVSFPAVLAFALWMLFRGARTKRGRDLALSGALFGLSLYAYSTARLLVPLTVGAAALAYARDPAVRRQWWRFGAPLALMAAPLALYLASHQGVLTWRFEYESIFERPSGQGPITQFLSNYLGYFSPRFLFATGDSNLRHGTGRGVLLWIWAPFVALGMWQAWRRRKEPAVQILAATLIIAPIGASLMATGQPHAIRSITAALSWTLVAALGLQWTLAKLAANRAMLAALAALALLDAGLFLHDYFGDYRARAFDKFDAGLGAVLHEAFARRDGRPLYLPPALHSGVRQSVFPAYWGEVDADAWRDKDKGFDAMGIHAWNGGDVPAGALIVAAPGQPPPSGAELLLSAKTPSGEPRYRLYEK